MKPQNLFPLLSVFAALFLVSPVSYGATIIGDDFSGTNAATIDGRTPDLANLPGLTWTGRSQGGAPYYSTITTSVGNPISSAMTGFNSMNFINISANGGYTKPSTLTLAADLNVGSLNGPPTTAGGGAGLGLGFYSVAPADFTSGANNFTGFLLNFNGGANTLNLISADGSGVVTTLGSVTLTQQLDTVGFLNLSYSLNTTTGGLTNVVFDGTDYTSSFTTTAFSNAATTYTGFYGSNPYSVSLTGYVDNFQLSSSAVPEPQSYVLIGLALSAMLVLRKGRRQLRA